MVDFAKLYFTLFNRVTDALTELDNANYGNAKNILIEAQQTTEELYLAEESPKE